MLQRLSSARDSPRRFLSSVAECKSLSEAFASVVNLRCSIRCVKPAEGGEAQVKAARSLGRGCSLDLTSASYGRVWICLSVCLSLKKKKRKGKKKKPIFLTKAMWSQSKYLLLLPMLHCSKICRRFFCMTVSQHLYGSTNGKWNNFHKNSWW